MNFPPETTKDECHKTVVENGGNFSMNLTPSVTHSIAFEKKGRSNFFSYLRGLEIPFLNFYPKKKLFFCF